MKKIMAILTALVLALTVGCTFAAAEDDSVPPSTPEMKAYEATWISEDGEALVSISRQDNGFQIDVVRQTGEDTFTSWNYLSNFNEETKSISDALGTKCDCRVKDGKDEVIEGTSADDIKASFTIGEDGRLTWKDESAGTETVCLKIGAFLGTYDYDRCTINFAWDIHENHYDILVRWPQSAWQVWEYQLVGTYDPKAETITCQGLKQLLTYRDDGEIDTTVGNEEAKVEGTFSFSEDGRLVWTSSDGAGDGIVFENAWIPLWSCIIAS